MLSDLDLLNLVCNRLEQSNIHYMLTGSFASNFYAVPRMTRDIDIVLEILKPDMDKFICVFQSQPPRPEGRGLKEPGCSD